MGEMEAIWAWLKGLDSHVRLPPIEFRLCRIADYENQLVEHVNCHPFIPYRLFSSLLMGESIVGLFSPPPPKKGVVSHRILNENVDDVLLYHVFYKEVKKRE